MRIILALIAAFVLMAAPCRAELYRYVDHKGVVTVTDKLDQIPKDLRKSARAIDKDASGTDGVAPLGSGLLVNSTPWVKPPEAVSVTLKAAGGWRGLQDSLSTPNGLIFIGGVLTLLVPAFVMFLIKRNGLRLAVIVVLLGCVYIALFSVHIKGKLERGEHVMEGIERAYNSMCRDNAILNSVIKQSP